MSTIKDLSNILSVRSHLDPKEAETFINTMLDVIKVGLNNDGQVKLKGLGTFRLQNVRERESIDVNTGKRVVIASHDRVAFTPDSVMKESVNKPFSHFDTVILNDGVSFEDTPEENSTELGDSSMSDTVVADIPAHSEVNEKNASLSIPEEIVPQAIASDDIVIPTDSLNASDIVKSTPHDDETLPPAVSNAIADIKNALSKEDTEHDIVTSSNEVEATKETLPFAVETSGRTQKHESDVEAMTTEEQPVSSVVETSGPSPVVSSDVSQPHNEDLQSRDGDTQSGDADCFVEDGSESFSWVKNLGIIAACFVIFCAGVFVGRITYDVPQITPTPVKNNSLKKVAKDTTALANDTISDPRTQKQEPQKTTSAAENTANAVSTSAIDETQQNQKEKMSSADKTVDASISYDYDARVRTGAWRIIGTKTTHVVKPGQTLSGISRTYLGPDMECYVEVYNGNIKEVKAGQTIKIPDLKNKKAK